MRPVRERLVMVRQLLPAGDAERVYRVVVLLCRDARWKQIRIALRERGRAGKPCRIMRLDASQLRRKRRGHGKKK